MPGHAQTFGDPQSVAREAEAWGRAHVASGGKLVGVVTASAPFELIEAAGMAAMELSAGYIRETPLADHVMEDLFHPPIRGLLERILRGDFAHLAAIVLPRTGDAPHRLYYYLCELQRTGLAVPKPLLFDITQTPGAASEAYAAQALSGLWDQLRAISGKGDDAALHTAIVASNKRRGLLRQLAERRREVALPGAEVLAAYAASRMLPPDQFEPRLSALLASGNTANGPRIVIAGSAHDDAGLHAALEANGAIIVGDDHGAGEPAIGDAIDASGPPLKALLTYYRATRAGARAFTDMAADLLAFAKAARADGVVFSYLPEEEALTWDYPEQARALARVGITFTRLGDQARPYDAAARGPEIAAFVQSVRDAQ